MDIIPTAQFIHYIAQWFFFKGKSIMPPGNSMLQIDLFYFYFLALKVGLLARHDSINVTIHFQLDITLC